MAADVPAKIPLFRVKLHASDRRAVLDVLKSGWLSGGHYLADFENQWKTALNRNFALGVSSGTAALDIGCSLMDFRDGRRVVTTPFTFIASTTCLLNRGAVPVLCDIDPETLNLDPKSAAELIRDADGALFVDMLGSIRGLREFRALCDANGVGLLEDSCQAVGAQDDDLIAGSAGDASVFGFFPNKQMTTGEGGVIAFDRPEWSSAAQQYRNQSRTMDEEDGFFGNAVIGSNYKLAEMNAALGYSQMARLDELLAQRAKRAGWYLKGLKGCEALDLPAEDPGRSWFAFYVLAPNKELRSELASGLLDRGISSRKCYPPTHFHPTMRALGYGPGDFPVAEDVAARLLFLPFDAVLSRQEVDHVVGVVRDLVSQW